MQANLLDSPVFLFFLLSLRWTTSKVLKAPLDYGIVETTLRVYSGPLRTLNVELLLIVPYGA